jgi:hypothetical protein
VPPLRSQLIRKGGRQSRAVRPRGHRVTPGPTAQLLLRPCLKFRSCRSIPPIPASGASARQPVLTSGPSPTCTARSGGSTARPARATPKDSRARSVSEAVACSERSRFRRRLGLDVIMVDIGHLPAQRGKTRGGASRTGARRKAWVLRSRHLPRYAVHRNVSRARSTRSGTERSVPSPWSGHFYPESPQNTNTDVACSLSSLSLPLGFRLDQSPTTDSGAASFPQSTPYARAAWSRPPYACTHDRIEASDLAVDRLHG